MSVTNLPPRVPKTKFWRSAAAGLSAALLLNLSGCASARNSFPASSPTDASEDSAKSGPSMKSSSKRQSETAEEVFTLCRDIYERAESRQSLSDLETIKAIIKRLGEHGYTAVDQRNQVNMENYKAVLEFCEKVQQNRSAVFTLIQIAEQGGFTVFDFSAKKGTVTVTESYFEYEPETAAVKSILTGSYTAGNWQFTEDGYLMFSGTYYSEDLYVLTLSGLETYNALRVLPLDETCRSLNRQYILPIGYSANNLFTENWSEEDFGELNFYDIFDRLCAFLHLTPDFVPADGSLPDQPFFLVPEETFEKIIMSRFRIIKETLRRKTDYVPSKKAYEYRPRGFYEIEYPERPYPETVSFKNNGDGTLTLTIHCVFPYQGTSRAYVHETTIRPLEDGGVQYVSNHTSSPSEAYKASWHTPRLTKKQWEEAYGYR